MFAHKGHEKNVVFRSALIKFVIQNRKFFVPRSVPPPLPDREVTMRSSQTKITVPDDVFPSTEIRAVPPKTVQKVEK